MAGDGPPEDEIEFTPGEIAEAAEQLAVAHQTDAALAEEEGDEVGAAFHRRLARVHEKVALTARSKGKQEPPPDPSPEDLPRRRFGPRRRDS